MNQLIKQAVRLIEQGKLVCLPTETVYGIATNALNKEAVSRVYQVKGRDFKNPLALMTSDTNMAQKYVKINDIAAKLAHEFCPGPLTLVLPKSDDCPIEDYVNANLQTLAIRIPDNEIIHAILAQIDCPVVFTSANPSGQPEALNASQVLDYFGDKIDLVIEGDDCSGQASTIVDLSSDKPNILREGEISLQQIEKIITV